MVEHISFNLWYKKIEYLNNYNHGCPVYFYDSCLKYILTHATWWSLI